MVLKAAADLFGGNGGGGGGNDGGDGALTLGSNPVGVGVPIAQTGVGGGELDDKAELGGSLVGVGFWTTITTLV